MIFNILLIISSVGTALMADENFKALLGDNIGLIGAAVGVAGFFLRFNTTTPIAKKKVGTAEEMGWTQADDDYTGRLK